MTTTSVSLLERLHEPNADAADWERFHAIYRPLIRRWVDRIPGLDGEVDDVARELAPMTVNAVVKAKARVLSRLREEAGGFLDQLKIFSRHIPPRRCLSLSVIRDATIDRRKQGDT